MRNFNCTFVSFISLYNMAVEIYKFTLKLIKFQAQRNIIFEKQTTVFVTGKLYIFIANECTGKRIIYITLRCLSLLDI